MYLQFVIHVDMYRTVKLTEFLVLRTHARSLHPLALHEAFRSDVPAISLTTVIQSLLDGLPSDSFTNSLISTRPVIMEP